MSAEPPFAEQPGRPGPGEVTLAMRVEPIHDGVCEIMLAVALTELATRKKIGERTARRRQNTSKQTTLLKAWPLGTSQGDIVQRIIRLQKQAIDRVAGQ